MLSLSFMFMGNRRFSYMSDKRFIVERGYLPLLEAMRAYPQVRADICPSGYSTLKWLEESPEVVDAIRRGIAEGRLANSTNGFEHVYLPTISMRVQEMLIRKGVEVDRCVYGRQPGGFWASDCAWDSTVIKPLVENGVRWAYSSGWLEHSNPGGPYYTDWRQLDLFQPTFVRGPAGTRLPVIHSHPTNYDILLEEGAGPWALSYETLLATLRERAASGNDGLFLIAMDFECLAVLECEQWRDKKRKPFSRLLDDLSALPGAQFEFVDEYLTRHPPEATVCLREYPPFDSKSWESGCKKLDTTCRQAEALIVEIEDWLAACPELATPAVAARLDTLWERLLLSLQSEPRMTGYGFQWDRTDNRNQCRDHCLIYPPDEMVLEAINDALAAWEGARALKRQLLPQVLRAGCAA
ncbi:MAG: hypothetical protein A3K19_28940 [Lentisphaerae bacterium RIFOXYB12_FULL_65_16]|nr:MAG: hypothetical protein A3K18_25525 [Lentisphaerae bacterium RIFOXYA12_64_32]OGV88320.1 MAG: hypothetical protein A3K19_28940 [Lentisphaerae bacterium RIFOXYB12_FULL_65_16]